MKISQSGTTNAGLGRAGRLLSLPILAAAMLATIGAQPALAQRDEQRSRNEQRSQNEQRSENEQRAEGHRDERRTPPGHLKKQYSSYSYGYYEAPRYVYVPPPVVYAPPSALEFVFPLSFR
jgi:hypothetical protein